MHLDLPQDNCDTTIVSQQDTGFVTEVISPTIGKVRVTVYSLTALFEKSKSIQEKK